VPEWRSFLLYYWDFSVNQSHSGSLANNHAQLGLLFISVAVLFWGILPIALKLSGSFIDPVTLTWFRFLVALLVSILVQWSAGSLKQFAALDAKVWLRLILAGLFLMLNYVSFVYSLDYLARTPQCGAAQLFCRFSLRDVNVFPSLFRFFRHR